MLVTSDAGFCSKLFLKFWVKRICIRSSLQVAAERVLVLNTVRSKLPVAFTTTDDAKDSVKEEIRLR